MKKDKKIKNPSRIPELIVLFVIAVVVYIGVANTIFQWRNPIANEISFYRDFMDVIKLKKLEKYQPREEK